MCEADRDVRRARGGTAVVVLVLAAAAAAAEGQRPRLVCREAVYDFGAARDTNTVEHTFILRNEGDAPVTIDHVRTTCGCTTNTLKEKTIAPGGQEDLSVRLVLRGQRGQQRKGIYVHSNDPHSPLRLEISGQVQADVELAPATLYFGSVERGATNEALVKVICHLETPLRVTGLETNEAGFCRVTLDQLEEGKRYEVRGRLVPEALPASGPFRGKVALLTDSAARPRIEITAGGFVQREISVVPSELILPTAFGPTVVFTRLLYVRSTRGGSVKVLGIESPDAGVECLGENLPNGICRVRVTIRRPDPALAGKAIRIRVEKASGGEDVLQIPLKAPKT